MTAPVLVALLVIAAACGDTGSEPIDEPTETSTETSTEETIVPTGSWRLVEAPVVLLDEWPVTATFTATTIGGTSACNSYGGTVEFSDGSISIGEVSMTAMGCETEVMDLEQAYLAALAGGIDRYTLDGDVLVLSGTSGSWVFDRLAPVPTADLVGTTWLLDGYLTGDAISNEPGMDAATLLIEADGTVSGSTNCRTFTGTWVESGSEILFTSFAMEGECPPVGSDLDGRIVTVLGDGFSVEIDGQRLTITAAGGIGLSFRAS